MRGKLSKGFTLIELMIVVAIVAILAALAYYNYSRYGYRARRSDGKEILSRMAAAQERYYTNFNSYATAITGATSLGFTTTLSTEGYYNVTTANGASGDTQTYKLTAAPVLGQPQEPTAATIDACGSLTLDNTGTKSQTGAATNGACW